MKLPENDPLAKYDHAVGLVQVLSLYFDRPQKDALVDELSEAGWRIVHISTDGGRHFLRAERAVSS